MKEKSKGKIITGSLAIAAAAVLCLASFIALIVQAVNIANVGKIPVVLMYFYLHYWFLSGGAALLSLSIYGLLKFSDTTNRKVGKASVISFLGVEGLFLFISVIRMIVNEMFFIDVLFIIYLLASIGLLVAYFVCNKKFPAEIKPARTTATQAETPVEQADANNNIL